MFGMCKVFFALPLANDGSVCYGMSRLSFLIMKMYRLLFDAFRYFIEIITKLWRFPLFHFLYKNCLISWLSVGISINIDHYKNDITNIVLSIKLQISRHRFPWQPKKQKKRNTIRNEENNVLHWNLSSEHCIYIYIRVLNSPLNIRCHLHLWSTFSL